MQTKLSFYMESEVIPQEVPPWAVVCKVADDSQSRYTRLKALEFPFTAVYEQFPNETVVLQEGKEIVLQAAIKINSAGVYLALCVISKSEFYGIVKEQNSLIVLPCFAKMGFPCCGFQSSESLAFQCYQLAHLQFGFRQKCLKFMML